MSLSRYRAWDKENDRMVYPSTDDVYFELTDDGINILDMSVEPFDDVFPHLDSALMQSTGLKDKNGVEIFEGDCFIKIFRTIEIPTGKNGIEKSVGIVKFHEGAFQVHIDGWGYKLLSEVVQPHIYGANDDYWENVVIGNIYENP